MRDDTDDARAGLAAARAGLDAALAEELDRRRAATQANRVAVETINAAYDADITEAKASAESRAEKEQTDVEKQHLADQKAADTRLASFNSIFLARADEAGRGYDAELAARWARLMAAQDAAAPGLAAAGWEDPAWSVPTSSAVVPAMVRLGLTATPCGPAPALVPLTGQPLFLAGSSALDILGNVLTRVVAASPPGGLQLHVFDPVGSFRRLGGLIRLYDRPGPLGPRLHTDPAGFADALAYVTSEGERVNRILLRSSHDDLRAYNTTVPRPLPHHLIIVLDAPRRWPDAALDRLQHLLSAGTACGVNVVGTIDEAVAPSRRFSPTVALRTDASGAEPTVVGLADVTVTLDRPAPAELVAAVCEQAGSVSGPAGPTLADVAPQPWWVESAADGIDLPVGWMGDGPAFLHLGDSSAHGLLVGRTGSGKTTLLHTLVHATCARYSPDEVELWLVDLKEGVEFARYAPSPDVLALPHLRVVAADADPEYGLAVLERLWEEVERRGRLFKAAPGGKVADFASYRRAGLPLPRIVLVMDEFHLLLSGEEAVSVQAWEHLKLLVRGGRAFGVHLLLASQSLGGLGAIGQRRVIFDNMALRVALRSASEDSRLALGDEAATTLDGLGACLVNTNGGSGSHQSLTVAYSDPDTQDRFRAQIAALDQSGGGRPVPKVFCGSEGVPYPGTPEDPNVALLGSPVDMTDHLEVTLGREPGRHLAIIGTDVEDALAVFEAAVRSLARTGILVVVADLTDPGGPAETALVRLAADCGAWHRQGKARFADLLEAFSPGDEPTLVAAFGLHRSGLKGPRTSGGTLTPAAEGLIRLLDDGPLGRSHLVGWWRDLSLLKVTVGHRWDDQLGIRVGVGVPPDDQFGAFGTKFSLRKRRAVLFDADRPGELNRFVPYQLGEAVNSETNP